MSVNKIIVLGTLIAKNSDGKILLVKRSAKSSFPDHWQFPEGKREPGESPEENVKREVLEELGVKVSKMKFLDVSVVELTHDDINFIVVRAVFEGSLVSEQITLSDEHTQFEWYTHEEVQKIQLVPGILEVINLCEF